MDIELFLEGSHPWADLAGAYNTPGGSPVRIAEFLRSSAVCVNKA